MDDWKSESSSGIENGDVTIICQESKLKRKIEEGLAAKNYSIVDCLIGGREKIRNLMSSAKHSRVRVVIFTNIQGESFQNHLAPLARENYLPFGSTLILHELSVKIHPYLKEFQRLRLGTNIENTIEQIALYIEVSVEAEYRNINDVKRKNKLYALMLLGTAINPSTETPFSGVVKCFQSKHGSFQNLRVGGLKQFLMGEPLICVGDSAADPLVSVTQEGLEIIKNCKERLSNSYHLRDPHLYQAPRRSRLLDTEQKSESPLDTWKSASSSDRPSVSLIQSPESLEATKTESKEPKSPVSEQEFDMDQEVFYKKLHYLDASYAYFMITSKLEYCDELQRLSRLPVLKVFDFDPDSRAKGLLNRVENVLMEKRNLTITTLNQGGESVSDRATHWVFMKGMRETADTVFEQTAYQWMMKYDQALQENCELMLEYCMLQKPAVFLILWYDEPEVRFLQLFLYQVQRVFSNESNKLPWEIVMCISQEPCPESGITEVINSLNVTEGLTIVDESIVVNWLGTCPVQSKKLHMTASFPKRNDGGGIVETPIPTQQLPWLNDVLETIPYSDYAASKEKENLGEEFVRGGLLEWEDITSGDIAVERAVHREVCKYIREEAIDECKSIVLRVMHSPGGGGTTFGRQVLWSLRKYAPCCVLIPSTYFPLNGIIERVGEIHKLTQLPVVILVDGRNEDVHRLFRSRKYAVVIIHVQRYSAGVKKTTFNDKEGSCYLAGKVTRKEASSLTELFGRFSPKSKKALESIRDDVIGGRRVREVFEFGLTAFNHEFKGVRKYVHGYMTEMSYEVKWWQKIITYLSLLKFYGQEGMYGEIFRTLIPKCEKFVSIAQVEKGSKFIIEEEGKWEINYNAVAKEVLELALAGNGPTKKHEPGTLSTEAKRNLHDLVVEFVRYIKSAVGNIYLDKVQKILLHVATTRDYKDADALDRLAEKKALSPLLEDINQEYRILVMRELTEAFPRYAEFHAHLGRLCSFSCRFEEAEQSLNEALSLRKHQLRKRDPNKMDDTRGRFHHMFGYSYLRKVLNHLRNKNHLNALKAAEKGVEHFKQGRLYAVYNRIYGYVGEVRIRLIMVEAFMNKYEIEKAFDGDVESEDIGLCQFVKDSHSVCDQLLVECQHFSVQTDLSRNKLYSKCVINYNRYYEKIQIVLHFADDSYADISLMRSKIASIKMKHQPDNGLRTMDDITSKDDITEIVNLLDKSINSLFQEGDYMGVEMHEWLNAIRHKLVSDDYNIIRILNRIEQWNNRNEFGFSAFYLYVLNILLAMFSSGDKQRRQYWNDAKDLCKKLKYSRDEHLIRGKEVLANHGSLTIRKLVSFKHLGGWDKETKTWKNKEEVAKLQVCTGTIVKSDRPLSGYISVDLGSPIPNCPIEIFFSPVKYNLHGQVYTNRATRVEFFIAFNTNGAEAESVRKMTKHRCKVCRYDTEVLTLNQPGKGACRICGQTD